MASSEAEQIRAWRAQLAGGGGGDGSSDASDDDDAHAPQLADVDADPYGDDDDALARLGTEYARTVRSGSARNRDSRSAARKTVRLKDDPVMTRFDDDDAFFKGQMAAAAAATGPSDADMNGSPSLTAAASARSAPRRSGAERVSEEAVQQYESVIAQLRAANEEMLRALKAKDKAIRQLKEESMQREMSGMDPSNLDAKDQKIVELLKKNKALTVALERERTNASRGAVDDVASKQQDARRKLESAATGDADEIEALRTTVRSQRDQVKKLSTRLSEFRQEYQIVKNELARTQRALQREVGDDVPLAKVLEEGSGWVGRAQQISLLQAKLKTARSASTPALPTAPTSSRPASSGSASKPPTNEEKQRVELDRRAAERQHDAVQLQAQLDARSKEVTTAKAQAEKAKVRCTALERDIRELREKMRVMLAKSQDDDALVEALKGELAKASERNKQLKQLAKAPREGPARVVSTASDSELADMRLRNERQAVMIAKFQAELQELRSSRDVELLDDAETQARLKILNNELEHAADVEKVLRSRLLIAEQRGAEAAAAVRNEKAKLADLERRSRARPGAPPSAAAAQRPDKIAALQGRLDAAHEEIEELRLSVAQAEQAKEGELSSMRALLTAAKASFDHTFNALRKRLQTPLGDD